MPTDQQQASHNKHASVMPGWLIDILTGLLTVGMIAVVSLVLQLNMTMTSHINSHVETHKRLENIIVELRQFAFDTRTLVAKLDSDYTEFKATTGANRYTIQQAYADQRIQAEELKKIWDQIHALQIDVVRLQNAPMQ